MKNRFRKKKNGDKSCQSNFDKRSSDFGSFLVIPLLRYIKVVEAKTKTTTTKRFSIWPIQWKENYIPGSNRH